MDWTMMKKILQSQLMKHHARIGIGHQINVNHENCPAGKDTKERLYIKRPSNNPNILIGYCHNCGLGGVATVAKFDYQYQLGKPTAPPELQAKSDEQFRIPLDIIYNIDDPGYHIAAVKWLQTFIDPTIAHKYGIGYSPNYHRVFIPNSGFVGNSLPTACTQYQLRRLDPDTLGPKYMTVKKRDGINKRFIYYNPSNERRDKDGKTTLVLCEDVLSAIKVVNCGADGVWAVPLMGTHIGSDILYEMVEEQKVDRYLVWLDNDNTQVMQASDKIKKFLDVCVPSNAEVYQCTIYSDPKRQSNDRIKDVLNECRR